MPTNEERREVAKELRYTASHSLNGYSFQRSVEGTVFGTIGDRPWRKTLTRIADLIEPEECTCHMEPTFIGPAMLFNMQEYECSECGKSTFSQVFGDDEDVPKYCSECGAKVVLDDGCWTAESRTANFCPNCGAKVASDD